eukprot:TRINITY_DN43859_c0_g1_i1.p1 TRINITY_DN43859_c0_g1~~TRINITY_DN43859_c0_g1_i1.p1  ORF type:complete len:260 (-),score=64.61 TRINITY_DN43859_c0_g1_i1:13-792(-)
MQAVTTLLTVRKALGIKSWPEFLYAGLTAYCLLSLLIGFSGIFVLPYIPTLALVGGGFAWYQLHLLGALQALIETYEKENDRFERQNHLLNQNVQQFQQQNTALKKTSDEIHEQNTALGKEAEHLSTTLEGLKVVQSTMQQLAATAGPELGAVVATLETTLQKQRQVVSDQKQLLDRSKQATATQSRILLMQLQTQCQLLDMQVGLSESEFQQLLGQLPTELQQQLKGKGFAGLDRDKDGSVNAMEFQALVNELVAASA